MRDPAGGPRHRRRVPAGPVTDSPLLWTGRVAGAALLVWMGWIHLHLWGEGYEHLPTIGPLLMADFVAAVVVALVLIGASRSGVVAAVAGAGALLALGTLGALALSVNVGLFGFTESWNSPFTHVSVGVETAAAAILLAVVAVILARDRRAGAAHRAAGVAPGEAATGSRRD